MLILAKDIFFEDCKIVELHTDSDGNDEINFAEIASLGDISVNRCNVSVSEYIKFISGIFSKFIVKNSSFELMVLDSLESPYVLIEGFKGHIAGPHMSLVEMIVKNSMFTAGGQPR